MNLQTCYWLKEDIYYILYNSIYIKCPNEQNWSMATEFRMVLPLGWKWWGTEHEGWWGRGLLAMFCSWLKWMCSLCDNSLHCTTKIRAFLVIEIKNVKIIKSNNWCKYTVISFYRDFPSPHFFRHRSPFHFSQRILS